MLNSLVPNPNWQGCVVQYERTNAISERHNHIIELIRTGELSSKRLASELGVSEPTVNRDIEFLRSQGYEIKAVRVEQRWAYRIVEAVLVRESRDPKSRGGAR